VRWSTLGRVGADETDRRHHQRINHLTAPDGYVAGSQTILAQRDRIKRQIVADRRLPHQLPVA
jgi:putative transposase